jgi:hypothetical protein
MRHDVQQAAQAIALQQNHRVLILTGKLDGPNGLPLAVVQYSNGLNLKMMGQYTRTMPMAIFEVIDEDALCAVIDQLQERGGYMAMVMGPDGRSDPSYCI